MDRFLYDLGTMASNLLGGLTGVAILGLGVALLAGAVWVLDAIEESTRGWRYRMRRRR
jgi:hypothetical protein